jgi:hypothetical protein
MEIKLSSENSISACGTIQWRNSEEGNVKEKVLTLNFEVLVSLNCLRLLPEAWHRGLWQLLTNVINKGRLSFERGFVQKKGTEKLF